MNKNKKYGILPGFAVFLVAAIITLAGCPNGTPSGVELPAEYQGTTWTRVKSVVDTDKAAQKVEFGTSDFTVTYFNGESEVWPITREWPEEEGYRVFYCEIKSGNTIRENSVGFKPDGSGIYCEFEIDWVKQP
jgi:hypothetical protein